MQQVLNEVGQIAQRLAGVIWQVLQFGRGRDGDCSPPPAQIPAGAANAPGSSLGFWRRSGAEATGVAP